VAETPQQVAERMARVRAARKQPNESSTDVITENQQLRDLIAWLAPRIERRNGNGEISDKFCLLCTLGQPEFKRQPCRHNEVWRIAKGE
jgi:hypothetical protein